MPSTFTPLRHRIFRCFWIVNLTSNIGTWMHIVAAAWLMTSMTSSPTLIALLQTALTLPVFFFSIPGGMLADIFSLKKFLCFTQTWMAVGALTLTLMTLFHLVTPWSLLCITFLLGSGAALNIPAMQTAITTMVPAEDLREASTLNSIGFNTARVVGPALGGCLVALRGPALVFMIDTISFLGVIFFFLWFYQHPQQPCSFGGNIKKSFSGFSNIMVHAPFQNILKRTAAFFFCASIIWALSPIIAKNRLGEGIAAYTHFVTCLGLGAVLGGLSLATLRDRISDEKLTSTVLILLSFLLGLLPFFKNHFMIYGILIVIGFTWITSASTFVSAVLKAFPDSLKSRAFALYWVCFNGSVALGSATWGKLASIFHCRPTLLACSALALVGALFSFRWKVEEVKKGYRL
ncbi:MAG: MFS transporter [Verrucomicrobia bacterium]|nr:MFS transporter [Verrucomicrobiota bacterium]